MDIRTLSRRKISKFKSLLSLIVLAGMLMLFFLFIPDFVASIAGKVFVVIWYLMAVLSFAAHGRSVSIREGRQYVPVYGIKKAEHSHKRARSTSPMRGL